MALQEILTSLPQLTPVDRRLIEQAYLFGEHAHSHQLRRSGEPFFVHCAAVANILAEMHLDSAAIAAALLHDCVEDTDVTLADIESNFGSEVATLVNGVTKVDRVSNQSNTLSEAEYIRKTLNAMSNDVRVILIKLADRLHNMRTLGSLKPARQRAIAEETLKLFAPLANRLGIWRIKADLEDLSFRYLFPEEYRDLSRKIQRRKEEREQRIEEISQCIQSELTKHQIEATVQGRPKNLYSIFRKMQAKGVSFEETYDVRGIRVIVNDVMQCYQALGIAHTLWRPVPGQFDDYIGAPKDNFYQSLHTAVFTDERSTFEVQIRTWEMHYNAEYGVSAHWRYKAEYDDFDTHVERRMDYLRDLINPAQVEKNPTDFVKVVMENIDDDRVLAVTPQGDVIDLPRKATPIDFAYYIHTEVGHRCRGARVNGKHVSLDYALTSGDRVEIITTNRGGPSLEWLDETFGYVHTSRARNKIREWFHKQQREKTIAAGREALEQRLRQLGAEPSIYDAIRATTDMTSMDDLLEAVGQGTLSPTKVIAKQLDGQNHGPVVSPPAGAATMPIVGARGYDVKIARCCNPRPGDNIVGYITRQATVTIHRSDCANLESNRPNSERLISVNWARRPSSPVFLTPVEITAHDRAGLMGEIGIIAKEENINMTNVSIVTNEGIATFQITMEIDSFATLSRALLRIQTLDNVIEARRKVTA